MKILLIDNGSTFLQDLQWVLHEHSVVTVPYALVDAQEAENFDAVILSGGHGPSAVKAGAYDRELALIKSTAKPLLGICLGFQLLCVAYDERLERLDDKVKGERTLIITQDDPLLAEAPATVFESHHWVVPSVHVLQELARSENGVEVVKHPDKPHYGVQFHPEKDNPVVIRNFLGLVRTSLAS